MDLTTAFANYTRELLEDAGAARPDLSTLIAKDVPNARAMRTTKSDLNTLYGSYCGLIAKVFEPSYTVFHNPAANPAVTTFVACWSDTAAIATSVARVKAAGAKHLFELFEWNVIEPSVGVYDTAAIDRLVAYAGELGLWINIAPISTDGLRHVPTELAAVAWDHASMISAYTNMLTYIAPRLQGRLAILTVGNESDLYLDTHQSEIAAYATFFGAVRTHARTLFGITPFKVAVGFQFAALVEWAQYAAITSQTDLASFTYYFLTGNAFATDLANMAAIIGASTPYVFQEIGYTSNASQFGSSQATQSAVASIAFGLLNTEAATGRLLGVVWHQLSDYNTNVLDDVFSTPLLEFFGEMGLRNTSNAAKSAWPTVVGFLGGVTGD